MNSLMDRYHQWSAEREDLETREDTAGNPGPEEWEASDDDAIELLQAFADALGPNAMETVVKALREARGKKLVYIDHERAPDGSTGYLTSHRRRRVRALKDAVSSTGWYLDPYENASAPIAARPDDNAMFTVDGGPAHDEMMARHVLKALLSADPDQHGENQNEEGEARNG